MLTDGYILALVAHSADESQYGATTWKASNLTQKNRKLTMPSIPKGETAPACQENKKKQNRELLCNRQTRDPHQNTLILLRNRAGNTPALQTDQESTPRIPGGSSRITPNKPDTR